MTTWRQWSRRIGVAGAIVGALIACSSEETGAASPEASFCSALSGAYATCASGADGSCGATIETECAKMASLLNPSALEGAMTCLQGASCDGDPLACLGKALLDLEPTAAQTKFAESFCESCATVGGDACLTAFFGAGDVPGLGVALLPFGGELLTAIDAACTSNRLGKTACQAAFSGCVGVTATKVLAETLSIDAATCVVTAIKDGLGGDGDADGGGDGDGDGDGGTDVVTGCGPDSCPGCCGASGTCETGNTSSACGRRGGACSACSGGHSCDQGQCIDPGCKASCQSGCCSANGCQGGNAASACGTGGDACVDCGGGRTCSAGACKLDGASRWNFVLIGAVIPPTKANGSAWDAFNGLPDPFAQATSGTTVGPKTPARSNTLEPSWRVIGLANLSADALKANLTVEVWDEDVAYHDLVGTCALSLGDAHFDGALHKANCPATPGGVAFTLEYRLDAL
jgi:hypothetical protein